MTHDKRMDSLRAALDAPALSADELAVFNSQRAAEMAKAKAMREPHPQNFLLLDP